MAEKEAGTPVAKVNKLEAVRQILADLGNTATIEEIQTAMKARFGVEMDSKMASTYKGYVIRKGAAKAKPAAKKLATKKPAAPPKEQSAPVPAPPADAANGKRAILLDDVVMLKTLVDRVGADHLKTLIDMMAK